MSILLRLSVAGIVSISLIGVIILASSIIFFCYFPVSIWWRALVSGAPIEISKLIAMKMRKVNLSNVVVAYITAKRSGLDLDITELETHVLAGGNIDNVVKAMIAAKNADIKLSLQMAKTIDLAGKDVYGVVQNCIVPKIVETPQIVAVAKDGFELKAKANITLKTNIKRIIGGADENTIILRVSEALTSTIGSAINHGAVLENPDIISETIMDKGLDYETAYEIVSLDIFDIQRGRNLALEQEIERTEKDKKQTQNKLEERRLKAIALEQENKAKIQEMRAKVVESEAEVPKALAKALNEGKISPIDYYDIQNLQADTDLRNVLSGKGIQKPSDQDHEPARPKPRRNPFNF